MAPRTRDDAMRARGNAATSLLGGRTAHDFLRRYWQKQALVVRGALPAFQGMFDLPALRALAERDDVESRLVARSGRRYTLEHGPFTRRALAALPPRNWTLLVQGVNLHSRRADALLRRFSFVPFARLDDLMVSYAAPGGGVGPHFDSYDVFLLQGDGERRWRYGRQHDLALQPRLPVRILQRFAPQHETVLGPGDMLYLPPQYAHDGVALGACTTYSIGFRAASANEVAAAFLDFLRDEIDVQGRYADPDLTATSTPARIDRALQRRHARMLAAIRWDRAQLKRFLGCWLSEPKPSVFFTPPARPLTRRAFVVRAARIGLRLNPRTQLLYDERCCYINGAALPWPAQGAAMLARLADTRALASADARRAPATLVARLYGWYRDGYLELDDHD